MILTRLILPVVLGLLFTASAEAQWVRTGHPIQRLDRWMGLGNGPGYHSRQPGSDPSWYNAWSPLNSTRYSAMVGPESGNWMDFHSAPGWSHDAFGSGLETGPATSVPREPTPAAPRDSEPNGAGQPLDGAPDQPVDDAEQAAAARLLDQQYHTSGWAGRE